jgi:hypothetical protein
LEGVGSGPAFLSGYNYRGNFIVYDHKKATNEFSGGTRMLLARMQNGSFLSCQGREASFENVEPIK